MIATISLIIIGFEDIISKFKDHLNDNKVNINIGIRSKIDNKDVSVRLVIKSDMDKLSQVLHDWFKIHNNKLVITGDNDSVDMKEMDEVVFSCDDSESMTIKKLEDLADRQKHYEANVFRSFRGWKSKGIL